MNVKNMGCSHALKIKDPQIPIFDVFRRHHNLTATLTANIFTMKREFTIWKLQRVLYPVPKFHELWSTNAGK